MGTAVMMGLLCLMAACSTTSPERDEAAQKAVQEKIEARVNAANMALQQGQPQQAFEQLNQAAKLDPAAKEPWLRKAQIHFEAREYGHAINDAKEVLQRDVNDVTAHSILAVSGLRVSADALAFLRNVDGVKGSTRSEAESVAKLLRESLGEPILVTPAAELKPAVRARRVTPTRVKPVTPAVNPPAVRKPAASTVPTAPATTGRANPFGALQ